MNPAEIIQAAMGDGVRLALSPAGTIKAIGEQVAVDRWRSILHDNKAEIVAILTMDAKGRTWTLGYPYICKCGEPTGFSTDGVGLCPTCEFGPHDPQEQSVSEAHNRQTSCRAFSLTGIHAVTRAELCLDRQGLHCGDCPLKVDLPERLGSCPQKEAANG